MNENWLTPIYNAANEGALITALQNLRENVMNLNQTSLITTYTYFPLIGVHTVTDPKGVKTEYVYDNYGRLILIKDTQNNIIKEYKYHYAE